MKRLLRVIVFTGAVCLLAVPGALARGGHGGHVSAPSRARAGVAGHNRFRAPQKSVFPQPVDPWTFWGTPHVRDGSHRDGRFAPFVGVPGFVGTPSVLVTTPDASAFDGSSVAYAPPDALAPGAPAIGAAPVFPTPMLVEYAGGWYQLRGDGVTTPYTWVWIPKPPIPPPASAVQAPPPPAPSSEPPPRSADSRTGDHPGQAYRWTDAGVTTWTNKLEKVPRRFRKEAAATAEPN
jgi:hypothetical protein